jgi:transcription-repair coupling factor (superfamily II helicase)
LSGQLFQTAKGIAVLMQHLRTQIAVGTQSLLQSSIIFDNLGLIVIDEEQRFGVTQKEKLIENAVHADILTLSATPIPRTLQMSTMNLKEMVKILTPPLGRQAVRVNVGKFHRDTLISAILLEVQRGGQVFVVAPHIYRAESLYKLLSSMEEFTGCTTLSLAHSKMENCSAVIDMFRQNKVLSMVRAALVLSTWITNLTGYEYQ